MSLFEITDSALLEVPRTSFTEEKLRERQDLQRLLVRRIDILGPDLFVLAEEYSEWDGSVRRIDILALDRNANLVVVELKRTRDGSHMELQALRYASMVSAMTFEQACRAHAGYREHCGEGGDAEEMILQFLGWDAPDEEEFGNDVRIILASEDFSREITSTVLWLNERGLDIRCLRLSPYRLGERLLMDVEQIVPLPEAEEYQIRVREKTARQRRSSREQRSLPEIWSGLQEKCTPDELEAARDIETWIEENAIPFTTKDGFAARVNHAGSDHYLLKVRQRGEVRVWFEYLANRPPFSDERLRLELLERLNRIPGVAISRDRIHGKPAIPLLVLVPAEVRRVFLETLDWIIDSIRKSPT